MHSACDGRLVQQAGRVGLFARWGQHHPSIIAIPEQHKQEAVTAQHQGQLSRSCRGTQRGREGSPSTLAHGAPGGCVCVSKSFRKFLCKPPQNHQQKQAKPMLESRHTLRAKKPNKPQEERDHRTDRADSTRPWITWTKPCAPMPYAHTHMCTHV